MVVVHARPWLFFIAAKLTGGKEREAKEMIDILTAPRTGPVLGRTIAGAPCGRIS
jgi:hypothetical protein